MKHLIPKIVLVLLMCLVACTSYNAQYPIPGEKICRSDYDCRVWEYCGFRHVDSYATCMTGHR